MQLGDLFTGQLVRLAAKQPGDNELLAQWSNDAEYMRQFFHPAVTPRSVSFYDERDKEKDEHGNSFRFCIRTLADDKLIGQTGLWAQWNQQAGFFWIGIGGAENRGKGYGTDATRLIVGYAFRELGLYRVGLDVFGYNSRAIRTYEKAGFVRECVKRGELYRDGQRYDEIGMSILRPEWEQMILDADRKKESA